LSRRNICVECAKLAKELLAASGVATLRWGMARQKPRGEESKSTFAISQEVDSLIQEFRTSLQVSKQRTENFGVRGPFLISEAPSVSEFDFSQWNLAAVSAKQLTTPQRRERATGHTASVSESGLEQPANRAIYTAASALDLSWWMSDGVDVTGNQDLAAHIEAVKEDAGQGVSEGKLLDRFADYQDTLFDLNSATADLRAAAQQADEGLSRASKDPSWFDRVKAMIGGLFERVRDAVFRIAAALADQFKGFKEFAASISELLQATGQVAREKIVKGFQRVSRALASVATGLISKLLAWVATVREVARQKGFKLAKVTVTMESLGFESVSILGFPIPIPKLATPNIQLEFE